MKNKSYYLIFGVFLVLSSCASTKLMDSWKSQSFDSLSKSKILVVSESPETDVRKSYEIAIASKLRAQNLDAIESHIQFPSLKEADTPEETAQIVQMFKDAGISGIILTSLKQTIETQNGSMASQTGIPASYKDKASFGPNAGSSDAPMVSTSKTYVLEALTYDLTLEEGKQLVNVCLVDVTDPDAPDKIQKTFTKIVADQFK
ncbi:hypothetical protein [Maribacter sp. 2308TA10-17]|uniref:hypothetical protein n=1 Tax=Maribacter sp. 2308TA10-17 TaxID=3386276 RepID=UPI0039BCCBA2